MGIAWSGVEGVGPAEHSPQTDNRLAIYIYTYSRSSGAPLAEWLA